uniref:C-type lectin domain-containing protein n=1 Tax=Panagrolaimus sp. JU765 TaxID=591449 RepID=A0AC34RGA0_9BILA
MMLAEKARRNFLSDAEFLIGGYKAENSTIWGWSDESIFNYKDWAAGEPINSTDEKCMISSVSYGFWYTTKT